MDRALPSVQLFWIREVSWVLIFFVPLVVVNRYRGPNRIAATFGSIVIVTMLAMSVAREPVSDSISGLGPSAILSGILCGFFLRMQRKGEEQSKAAGEEAVRRGILVDEVERDLPYWTQGNRKCELKPGRTPRYSLPRTGVIAPPEWRFLMRTKEFGTQYGENFRYEPPGRPAPAGLDRILNSVINTGIEEFIEFEATRDRISVFWEAPGESLKYGQVFDWLEQLARV